MAICPPPISKLTLNRNNDSYYQTYLVPLGHLPQRGFRVSEHGLRKAFEWFETLIARGVRLSATDLLPQHPGAGWEAFTEEEIEALIFSLGNMTLLQAGQNRDLGAGDFAAKRPVYAASSFSLTRKIAEENADWTPERIATRQNWMARQATSIWRIA